MSFSVSTHSIPLSFSYLFFGSRQIVGDDTTALQSVLQADVWRHHLLTQEATLTAQLNAPDLNDNDAEDMGKRLGEIQAKLIDIEAETGPSRAAQLLVGLGFEVEDQQKPTRAFSGGWRFVLRPFLSAPEKTLMRVCWMMKTG